MLRHRRTHGEAVVAALEQQEKEQAAARPPPPAVFNPPIVNQQVGEGSSGPMNVQWMVPNRATRPYRHYPDIPRTTEDMAVPMAAPTTYSSGAMPTSTTWQSTTPSDPAQNPSYNGVQATKEGQYRQQ
ncbi:uncharacterized protein SCHCODRAFT_02669792 [Schizophyllum commune H4-8]|nr:uncharacterized protein SCHCODRAFT_02669792 [Schizophyllum commune H4-8]KAI5890647.1 hypothetical protein SCHCODRAFT_02669792 [Schizophyllum commune H4-8]